MSSTLEAAEWEHTTVLDGDLLEEVHTLKSGSGADIVTTGT